MCLFYSPFRGCRFWVLHLKLDPKGDRITCPAFGLYSSPDRTILCGTCCVGFDESLRTSQSRVSDRLARRNMKLLLRRNENQHILLVPKNWKTTKMTNLLVVQIAQPFLQRKMKMINLWCNLLPEKKRRSVNLLQYAEFLHRYEEEKDSHSGEIRLPHWNKMCQETRVSDQKTSRVW